MGRQAADTGTYAMALSESGNKESTHSHCVPSQVSAVATTYNCSNCQQSATRCVDCGTANTSKHSFFSLQLQNYAKLCRRKKMYKKDSHIPLAFLCIAVSVKYNLSTCLVKETSHVRNKLGSRVSR